MVTSVKLGAFEADLYHVGDALEAKEHREASFHLTKPSLRIRRLKSDPRWRNPSLN